MKFTPEDTAQAREWAEHIAAGVYDMLAIETREEFKAALVQAFDALTAAARAEGERRGLERAAQYFEEYARRAEGLALKHKRDSDDEDETIWGAMSDQYRSYASAIRGMRALAAEEGGEG